MSMTVGLLPLSYAEAHGITYPPPMFRILLIHLPYLPAVFFLMQSMSTTDHIPHPTFLSVIRYFIKGTGHFKLCLLVACLALIIPRFMLF